MSRGMIAKALMEIGDTGMKDALQRRQQDEQFDRRLTEMSVQDQIARDRQVWMDERAEAKRTAEGERYTAESDKIKAGKAAEFDTAKGELEKNFAGKPELTTYLDEIEKNRAEFISTIKLSGRENNEALFRAGSLSAKDRVTADAAEGRYEQQDRRLDNQEARQEKLDARALANDARSAGKEARALAEAEQQKDPQAAALIVQAAEHMDAGDKQAAMKALKTAATTYKNKTAMEMLVKMGFSGKQATEEVTTTSTDEQGNEVKTKRVQPQGGQGSPGKSGSPLNGSTSQGKPWERFKQ